MVGLSPRKNKKMAKYPGATWRDIGAKAGYKSNGKMRSSKGLVLHVNVSNGNLFNWVNSPSVEMSCHFQVYKDGSIEQYVDTDLSSWCQQNGNNDWYSAESEGYPNEPLTDAAIKAFAGLYKWLHETYGIPYQITDTPSGMGFGWHGMGGDDWGGHPACPGDLRKPQRQLILNMASGTGDDDMSDLSADSIDKLSTAIAEKIVLPLTTTLTNVNESLGKYINGAANAIIGAPSSENNTPGTSGQSLGDALQGLVFKTTVEESTKGD